MENALRRSTSQGLDQPTAYVSVLALGYAYALLAGQIWPDVEALPGLSPSEIVVWVSVLVGVILWLRCREWSSSTSVRVFLGVVLLLWALSMTLELVRGPVPERAAVSLGLSLALMIAKPPGPQSAVRIMTVVAWFICVLAAVSVLLEALGLAWAWSSTADAFRLGDFERTSYWLPISHYLGIDGRWAGPFIHPNRAGPVAALLLVFGVSRRGLPAWVFTLTGLAMLALAASRSADIAAFAGLVTLLGATYLVRRERRTVTFSWAVSAVALVGVVVLLAAPAVLPVLPEAGSGSQQYLASAVTGTGRTTIWPLYVQLWQQSPWTGIGAVGIFAAVQDGTLPAWAIHAHNTYLDALTRHGVLAFLLVLVVTVFALVVTVKAARRGMVVGLALVAVIAVNGIGHTVMNFVFPEVPLWVLLLAVMMSAPEEGARDGR